MSYDLRVWGREQFDVIGSPQMGAADFVRQLREQAVIADRSKALYWRELKLRRGPSSGLRIADELRRQVLAQRPDWPTEKERDEDHAAHLRVLDALDRTPRRG